MDQSQADKKSPNIWNKFESAAPGVPDWIQNKEQTGNILNTLLKTIPAQAILISTTSDVFLLVGDLETSTQNKILQVLDHFWDPVQKSDLTRYLKNENGEVTGFIFCANLFQQLIITLYYQDTPTLSMARAHTKRITRALSGQTVASYEAKTIPVDAAVAAQMRKFFEQQAKKKEEAGSEEELPMANMGPSAVSIENLKNQPPSIEAISFSTDLETPPVQVEQPSMDEFLPSMDDLLGQAMDTREVDVSTSSVLDEIENLNDSIVDNEIRQGKDIKIDFQSAGIDPSSVDIEEISEEDLALLSDELDDFFMDDDSDIDLQEQKEKLAALLQEMPTPDPDGEVDDNFTSMENSDFLAESVMQSSIVEDSNSSASAAGEDFTLPWEGATSPDKPETAPVYIEPEQTSNDNVPQSNESATFQQAMQQSQAKAESGPRPFTIVLIPRTPFHELGLPFEKKFDQYFSQTCQMIECEAESTQIFSDHVQVKLTFNGKGSIARTIIQLKKLLEIKILENYSTLSEELGEAELWIPGQLLFGENEKADSKRINEFIRNAQS
jgi:hypothetical protein